MIDVTDATFEVEVLDRSTQVPVVVDLWAPWCGPCKTLGPILEKVIAETDGGVVGVKVDTDQNPSVASAFRVQSIPFVVAIRDRQVVSQFLGAQPEPAVREFVQALVPSVEETEVDRLVALGDEASLRQALELDADHEGAVVALAELLATSERQDEALELLGRVPDTPAVRRVAALARRGAAGDDVEMRLDALLEKVKTDDEARQEFLDLLELLGPDDERTATFRRALAARLY